MMSRYTLAVLIIFLSTTLALSQSGASSDTTSIPFADSLRVSPLPDTTSSSGGIDTVVNYSAADSIVYDLSTKTMELHSRSQIAYQAMQLSSERIDIDWSTATLHSFGVPDTSDSARALKKGYRGTPVMKDAGEEFKGFSLRYNFRTKRGKIDVGDTQIDEGYYHGEDIKRVDKNVLFVEDGRYTTCDLPDPHYYFASPKMKVMFQDKVVAEPVYLYIADVPIFGLPFGVFPNQRGRRSGIIAPAYGDDARRGKFLSHLGYYWAIGDYMDLGLRSDLYTKGGWALYSDYRYALRYNFSGSVSGEYRRLHTGEENDPGRTEETSYRLNLYHNQEIDPTTRANVNFTFTSNNAYRNTIDTRQALDQFITSNATISKFWEGTPNSISLNVNRSQNLQNGNITEVLPSLSFNHSQSYPFRFGKGAGETETAWYENIGFSYGASASNNRSKVRRTLDSISVRVNERDTIQRTDEFERNRSQSLSQNVGLSIAPKLGYITISPSFSYRDERSFIDNDVPTRATGDSVIQFTNVKETRRAGFLSTGLAASTKLYGTVQPGLLGIAALRHTMTPGLSFSYSKQIVGEDRLGKQMVMSFNVGNVFEMKTIAVNEKEQPQKIQLLNLGAGISYNFSVDSLNFSPLNVSYRTGIGQLLDIGGGASFDLYKLQQTGPNSFTRVNKFLLDEEGRLARLTNFSISLSTSLSGERKSKSTEPGQQQGGTTYDSLATEQPQQSKYYGLFREEEPDFSIPWSLSLSIDYSENKVRPFTSRSANMRGDLEFNLTEKWKFSMNGGYDLVNKEMVVPSVNITRDLHCWVMNFSWVPTGNYEQYRFEIRVKSPQLQDVKVTKQGSDRSIY